MQFNNNGYHGSFFVSTLCFSPEASKASCVLNNEGAAACLPSARMFCFWNTKWQPTISLCPSLIKALPCWIFLWLDQSFDLCCQVTFPDPTAASREGTLAGAPGNYLDSSVVGGCHWALVFLMSPLTPASVATAREIWRPCWAVNNRIYLPVCDQHCHLCSPWWNVPMLIFRGDVFFLSVPGYKERRQMANRGRELSTGWLSWQCPGLPWGRELPEVESQGRWRMTRDSWRSGRLFPLWADTMDGSQQWETPVDVQCPRLSHLFNHQAPIGLMQVCVCIGFDFCMYEVYTVSALCSFSFQLLTFFFNCPCFHIIVTRNTDTTVFPFLWTFSLH